MKKNRWMIVLAAGLLGSCLCLPANAGTGAYGNMLTLQDDAASGELGQKVRYTITGEIPDTSGFLEYGYEIRAGLTEGLTWDENPVVYFGQEQIAIRPEIREDGFSVCFDMTKWQDRVGQPITVTYTAGINEKAGKIGTAETAWAELRCDCDPGDGLFGVATDPVQAKVWTSELLVELVSARDSSEKVEGAQFLLGRETEEWYCREGNRVIWTKDRTKATPVTTDASGCARFPGLKNGTYYAQQILAPEGFLINEVPEPVWIRAEEVAERVVCHLKAQPGAPLPMAGGKGKMGYYLPGILLMLTALGLAMGKRNGMEAP